MDEKDLSGTTKSPYSSWPMESESKTTTMREGRRPTREGGSKSVYIRITCPCDLYPLTPPLLYSKIVRYRGKHNFLIFALKHIW